MLTVEGLIQRMRYRRSEASGTVLWSALLPTGREARLTRSGLGLERGVRQVLPVRYTSDGFVARGLR
ncbi:hypothetical protein MPSYJ_07460 [Mycolicibacterium psychrotolerans]|uniref:Uncharacterized protein n=1 Tax=Mycolicibacterium psychrotolerans TaxID=216929 RepID=A0A7I7M514_9MYCO|nr:hypothetical protein MPSYJ_07460 [Mycolicibacterium psychrotolerans]